MPLAVPSAPSTTTTSGPTAATATAASAHLDPAADGLAGALRLLSGRLARRLRHQALGGLTPSQMSALATLERHGPMHMGRLARLEHITPPSVTSLVGRLCDAGLVDRTVDTADARSATVRLTPAGAALLDRTRHERTAFLRSAVDRFTEDERTVLAAALPLLTRLAEDDGE